MWASCSADVLSTCGAMLSGPLALLGFTCWNSRRPSSSLVWSLWKSSSTADAPFKASWIWPWFREKSWQSKRLKNWFSSSASSAVFTEKYFLCVTIYIPVHQLHTTPHASQIITRQMTYYFLFILLLLLPNFLSQFLLYRLIFFLTYILPYRSYGTQISSCLWYSNSFSYPEFVICEYFYTLLWNCMLYTEFNTCTHWFSLFVGITCLINKNIPISAV